MTWGGGEGLGGGYTGEGFKKVKGIRLRFGPWNVESLAGKSEELARRLRDRKINGISVINPLERQVMG